MSEQVLDPKEALSLKETSKSLMLGDQPFKALSCKYCLAIIEEYNRCLMEHQIPQSPSQQAMLTQFILKQNDFRLLQSLV